MSILIPKNRLVSFRLSQREYDELQALCTARRARSMSDLVRDTMHRMILHGDAGGPVPVGSETRGLLLGMPSVEYPRYGAASPQQQPGLQVISTLTDMLLSLHRRTEALGRQVNHLTHLMQKYGADSVDDRWPSQDAAGTASGVETENVAEAQRQGDR